MEMEKWMDAAMVVMKGKTKNTTQSKKILKSNIKTVEQDC
jgi:hypothetical protein